MHRILRCAVVLLIADSTMVNFGGITRAMADVAKAFVDSRIVPDLIPVPPTALVTVRYPSGVSAQLGNKLSPTQVQNIPFVTYEADPNCYYTLVLAEPNVPTSEIRILGAFKHWLVVNIPGNNVDAGETLASYIGSLPPPLSGIHRYTFIVYPQPDKLSFDEPRLLDLSSVLRVGFSVPEFAKKYNFCDPIAGNFFLSEFDVNVPILNENDRGVFLEWGGEDKKIEVLYIKRDESLWKKMKEKLISFYKKHMIPELLDSRNEILAINAE